jgi:hypothetical protein
VWRTQERLVTVMIALDMSGIGAGLLVTVLMWGASLMLGSEWLDRFNSFRLGSDSNRQRSRRANKRAAPVAKWGGLAAGSFIVLYSFFK